MFWPCETRTSTCRNFATISSGVYRFFGIAVLLHVKRHSSGRTTSKREDHRPPEPFLQLCERSLWPHRQARPRRPWWSCYASLSGALAGFRFCRGQKGALAVFSLFFQRDLGG